MQATMSADTPFSTQSSDPVQSDLARIVEARKAAGRPERRLAAAVMLQALDDLTLSRRAGLAHAHPSRSAHMRGTAWRATAWFASDATGWPFAFRCLCEVLELDPQRVRRLLGILPRPAEYWGRIPG